MNKRTFTLAVIFFIVSLVWLAINVYWCTKGMCSKSGLVIPSLFFVVGVAMMINEFNKKRRKHIADVNKNQIP